MKLYKLTERGQALVVIALAAVVLFGFAALAIDGSAKFSDRRHAQNAADTAAIAAALAKVNAQTSGLSDSPVACPDPSPSQVCSALQLAGLDRAASNGYNNNLTTNTVEIHSPPISGYYSGKAEYVQVIITSHVKTYFARVIGIAETHNIVSAVSLTKKGGPVFDGASIVSLNPDTSSGCSGTLRFGGGSTITLSGGGMFLNSDESDCAMEQQGGCGSGATDLLVINGGGIASAGNGNVDFDGCLTNPPTITYDQQQYVIPDDVYLPDVPIECSTNPTGNYSQGQTTHLYPGKYTRFPPNGSKPNIILEDYSSGAPGVFCIDTSSNSTNWGNGDFNTLTGNNITIYFRKGEDFKINGGDNITLDASDSGEYEGFLFIMETDLIGSLCNFTINGTAHNNFSGTIYAPYCEVTLTGSGSSTTPVDYSTQVIGWNVQITGNSEVDFIYDPGDNGENKRRIGLMK